MFLLSVFLLFLPYVSQSILPSISHPPPVFLCFLSNLPFLVFSFLSSNISSKFPPFCSLSPAIYKGEKGERGLLPQGLGGQRPLGSHPRAACRTCLLCIFVLAVQGVYVLLVFRVLGERGIGKIQGNKPLLPLPLRVQGKKK